MDTYQVKHTISRKTSDHTILGYSPVIIRVSDGCCVDHAYAGGVNSQPHFDTQKESEKHYEKAKRTYSDEEIGRMKKETVRGYEQLIKNAP